MSIEFGNLDKSNLVIDETYECGTSGNISDEVLSKLMNCCNSGGFRVVNNIKRKHAYYVLYTTGEDLDWKDYLDIELGRFIYYGDNKTGGQSIHNTKRKGNEILRTCFENLDKNERQNIAPFFVFKKTEGRSVKFLGLAVPGDDRMNPQEQLTSLWSQKNDIRYQNYKSIFSLLDVNEIDIRWLNDLINCAESSIFEPYAFKKWKEGKCNHLIIQNKVVDYRNKQQQLPQKENDKNIIRTIYDFFPTGYSFEKCAAEIVKLMDNNVIGYELTPPTKDGGRDAIGTYRIGPMNSNIKITFYIEAKRYNANNPVGVKDTSRLISRIKNREFGVLITTSYLDLQAYKEIVEDRHPVIVISSSDIVTILANAGIKNVESVKKWLNSI